MKRTGTRFRVQKALTHYDTIVIGSGIGGLCTAALLAKTGQKVCVLEQHYTAGGYTHVYERGGYEWDVGVHYIGEVHKPWSVIRRVFDVITDGQLEWAEMDQHYDHIVIGGKEFRYLAGRDAFKEEIKRHFPEESAAIDRYVDLISEVSSKIPRFFAGQALPRSLGTLYNKLRRRLFPAYFFQSTREVLEGLTQNQELIGVLTAQWGDYGLPPAQAAFVMHAMVAKHYITGGNYPVGGSVRIAETIIPVIEATGGHVFTYAGVEQVLVKDNTAYGVKMAKDGHVITADKIVSCAGLLPTYDKLLPKTVAAPLGLLKQTEQVKPSASHVCIYAGFNGDSKTLKLPKTNYWLYPEFNHDLSVKRFMDSPGMDFPMIYISFPSAKDPDWNRRYPDKSTVEIVAPSFPHWFEQWKGSTWNKRGEDYEAFKEKISQVLLEALYQHQPQLREALDFYELSTPLSTEWFQWNQVGEIYGLEHTVKRFEQHWIHPQTEIKNFYLTGSDVVTAGVGGALMGGVLCTARMLGWKAYKVKQMIADAYQTEPSSTAQTASNV
ncbi:phytoene desaturase family protein [Atopomonas sediminilitoris]|uniref:phytoene desaturase family protein n=1 Tax=Atopomonas sediminilitoris TaxID=2919919 RepID=UPI001F4EE9B7|nr:NAD(P)/FAD-dependent oxidoreductase [Atopomonas sediminilitoris]MCJ8170428.1 NAD(P)/FAD-dependent oxidoreductase [Atopomonas sediminilitoris]